MNYNHKMMLAEMNQEERELLAEIQRLIARLDLMDQELKENGVDIDHETKEAS